MKKIRTCPKCNSLDIKKVGTNEFKCLYCKEVWDERVRIIEESNKLINKLINRLHDE